MVGIPSAVNAAQEIIEEISPAPVQFKRTVTAKHVINRLKWGKPDLTIIDVRDRKSFNCERITGAVLVSTEHLIEEVHRLAENNRDLYVYGEGAQDTVNAAAQLDRAGFNRVSVIDNGLADWKTQGGPTEGRRS